MIYLLGCNLHLLSALGLDTLHNLVLLNQKGTDDTTSMIRRGYITREKGGGKGEREREREKGKE